MWSISLLNGHPPQTRSVIMLAASRQLKVSQPTSPKEPGGPKVIIPLALITDHCVLSAEYISHDLCTAALQGVCVCACVCACAHIFSHHWTACSMPEIQTQSCKRRREKRQNYALQCWPGMLPLQHQIMTENAELCAFFNVEIHWQWMLDGELESSWPSPSFSS